MKVDIQYEIISDVQTDKAGSKVSIYEDFLQWIDIYLSKYTCDYICMYKYLPTSEADAKVKQNIAYIFKHRTDR